MTPAEPVHESVLVVVEAPALRDRLRDALRQDGGGREVFLAGSVREGVDALHHLTPDAIVVGLDLPDLQGPRVLEVFRDRAGVPLIAFDAVSDLRRAVVAIQRGAIDYVGGDGELEAEVATAVRRALKSVRMQREVEAARTSVREEYGFSHLLTQSPRMLTIFDQIRKVAPTDATVLVRGETGTGKELISSAIHQRSRRRDGPLVAVNCGAFAESLLESELFGHERGSFTGASARREGLFEMADGGTLFLDELGETSLNVQVNLLRVLEEMQFRRVGGRDPVQVDVRIVAATNVGLEKAVEDGAFREDLFYRLSVFPIFLPPLRERKEDIPLLMRHFLDHFATRYELDPPAVASGALKAILEYDWPGNVRQLRAQCERWVVYRAGKRLEREDLGLLRGRKAAPGQPQGGSFPIDDETSLKSNTDRATQEVERVYLHKVLRRNGGHLERTAQDAGISRRTLYTKMRQYGLEADDFK